MYFDTKPCQVCGAEVELRPRRPEETSGEDPVGDAVAEPDATVDERVCTDGDCPSHAEDGPSA